MILFPESFTQKSLDNHFFHGYKGNLENYFMEDVLILKKQLCYLRNFKVPKTYLYGEFSRNWHSRIAIVKSLCL